MRGLNSSKEQARTEPTDEPCEGTGAEGGSRSKRARRTDGLGQVDGGTEAESAAQQVEVTVVSFRSMKSIDHIFDSEQGKEGKWTSQGEEGIPGGRRTAMEKAHGQLPLEES